jgi:hypothetical protein
MGRGAPQRELEEEKKTQDISHDDRENAKVIQIFRFAIT